MKMSMGSVNFKQCILISQFLNGNYIYFLPKVLNKCTVSSISLLNSDVFPFSFVRSVSMDKWKDSELEKMKAGGNRKALEFFQSQSDFSDGMSIQDKYNSKAAALLRDKVWNVKVNCSCIFVYYHIAGSMVSRYFCSRIVACAEIDIWRRDIFSQSKQRHTEHYWGI